MTVEREKETPFRGHKRPDSRNQITDKRRNVKTKPKRFQMRQGKENCGKLRSGNDLNRKEPRICIPFQEFLN